MAHKKQVKRTVPHGDIDEQPAFRAGWHLARLFGPRVQEDTTNYHLLRVDPVPGSMLRPCMAHTCNPHRKPGREFNIRPHFTDGDLGMEASNLPTVTH